MGREGQKWAGRSEMGREVREGGPGKCRGKPGAGQEDEGVRHCG